MDYSDFTIKKARDDFNLKIIERSGIFEPIEEIEVSPLLIEILDENVALAIAIHTEKARSELIVSNVLVELRKQLDHKISLFSGIDFEVDKTKGLAGRCDFMISHSPQQLILNAPVVTLVEGKNGSTREGIGQCIAEMVASQIFNTHEKNEIETIYGIITTGVDWKFMYLRENVVHIDLQDYHIDNPGKIMGILSSMFREG